MKARRALLLGVLACLGAALGVHAQSSPAPPLQPSPSRPAGTIEPGTTAPLPWSRLDVAQQRMLAPLQPHWSDLEPSQQQRLARHARRWSTLPAARQDRIRGRLARWSGMTPVERQRLRENERAYQHLSAPERARIAAAYRRYQSLPPEQRRALRARWHALQQRRQHRPATDSGKVMPLRQPAPAATARTD